MLLGWNMVLSETRKRLRPVISVKFDALLHTPLTSNSVCLMLGGCPHAQVQQCPDPRGQSVSSGDPLVGVSGLKLRGLQVGGGAAAEGWACR